MSKYREGRKGNRKGRKEEGKLEGRVLSSRRMRPDKIRLGE